MKLIDKDALLAKIIKRRDAALTRQHNLKSIGQESVLNQMINELNLIISLINTLEVKEVDVWKTVDNINPPQADKNKIYCVFTEGRHILATVINHPKDEELLQWKCTEFPFHRYDMCEGDKYMQIV